MYTLAICKEIYVTYLTENTDYSIEMQEDSAACNLHNVVQGLTGKIPGSTVWVFEACNDRLDQLG